MKTKRKIHLSSFQIIIIGFAAVILLGSLLLCIPAATRAPGGADFSDALFTATSAVCVTGLITQDTATYWSAFGQFIIMALIQIGGMGVITVGIMLGLISRRKVSLMQKSTMQEAISAPDVGGIIKLTKFVIIVTAATEFLGAVCMFPVFYKEYGVIKGIWYAVFHSVSAFCNAGFDLMGSREKFSSLTYFYNNPVINLVITFLIVFGGIGFLTWNDFYKHKFRFKRYRLQSKVALIVTAFLIVIPFLYFYIFEFSSDTWNNFTAGDKFWASLFQTITPRTAGFNTVNLAKMSQVSTAVTIILMLIGGSPGSTAGGMKTTTLAVMVSSGFSVFKRKNDTEAFHRRIPIETVRHASAVFLMYISLLLFGGLVIAQIEGIDVLTCLYETASAIGTVGLTLGITPSLHESSKLILILLMYIGRVGGLTLVFAAMNPHKNRIKYPQEQIIVG
ncbi:MAG: Trk family potassium uptake protein [Clostridiales bacterium]|nr:Trk family potassium uptake protein [Clostridiales bacterium]